MRNAPKAELGAPIRPREAPSFKLTSLEFQAEEFGGAADWIGVGVGGSGDVGECAGDSGGGLQREGGIGPTKNDIVAAALDGKRDGGDGGVGNDGGEGEANFQIVYQDGRADVGILAET